jgi:hypothetical protein
MRLLPSTRSSRGQASDHPATVGRAGAGAEGIEHRAARTNESASPHAGRRGGRDRGRAGSQPHTQHPARVMSCRLAGAALEDTFEGRVDADRERAFDDGCVAERRDLDARAGNGSHSSRWWRTGSTSSALAPTAPPSTTRAGRALRPSAGHLPHMYRAGSSARSRVLSTSWGSLVRAQYRPSTVATKPRITRVFVCWLAETLQPV